MSRDEELLADPECARCAAPLVDTRSAVVRDGQTYCCVHCARADAADIATRAGSPGKRACSRCAAPIPDTRQGIQEGAQLFCCPNCSAAGIDAEPLPES
ncbi:MAG: hypothetical protein KGN00_10535 [Chloroflexota bacterium]|nr:hypothetical protein [Chloroflexota bacterium]MDE3194115.1 hypothetical protein [Chloroflexota bacterium]